MATTMGVLAYDRHLTASSSLQRASLAELPINHKYSRYEGVSLEARASYFGVSCRPITATAEDDMELLSDIVTWGEEFTHFFEPGTYSCARCQRVLYSSRDKWVGPCVWPSFRQAASAGATAEASVRSYNGYKVEVREVYCGGCDLFIGHAFEDGRAKGDTHPEAQWRH